MVPLNKGLAGLNTPYEKDPYEYTYAGRSGAGHTWMTTFWLERKG